MATKTTAAICEHLCDCTEAHVHEHIRSLPPASLKLLPPNWLDQLQGAGLSWGAILALLVQGIPAILKFLALIQPLIPVVPPAPAKAEPAKV